MTKHVWFKTAIANRYNMNQLRKIKLINRQTKGFLIITFLIIIFLIEVPAIEGSGYVNYDLIVTISPSNTPIYGYFTNRDTINLAIKVYNPSKITFEGGYLTGLISAPSTQWSVNMNISVPVIKAGESFNTTSQINPQEPGVYTVTLKQIKLNSWNSTTIQGGFAAINVENVQTFYMQITTFVSFFTVIIALIAIFLQGWSTRRTLNEMTKQRRAQVAVTMQTSADIISDKKGNKTAILVVQNTGPGAATKISVKVITMGIPNAPHELKFDIPSLGVGIQEILQLGLDASKFTGSEMLEVSIKLIDVSGEEQKIGSRKLSFLHP